jgi:hypothetical protein
MSRFWLAALAVLIAPAYAEDARFFAGMEDVPLPPGFTETEAAPGFESAQGRLVFAAAEGAGPALAVRDFYYETLPELGWSVSDEGGAAVFQRGRERLHFYIESEGRRVELRVHMVVRPAATGGD